jgi:tocopherol O-methyltransferase
MLSSNRDIADYYNTSQIFYTYFWSRTALHYGFWYEDTKTLAEAVRNTDNFVIDNLKINSKDIVLDAGCGVGGTAIYVAENTGAKVWGITLSKIQQNIAREKALKSKASNLLKFSIRDYTETNFENDSFSKIFGIESICYASSKMDFLKEAYRILKPGGKIAIIDGFLIKDNLDQREEKIYRKSCEGWVLPNLAGKEQFCQFLEEAGFKNITYRDTLENIKRSSRRLYLWGLLMYPINFLLSKIGITRENVSIFYQKALFEGICTYGVFVAEKPLPPNLTTFIA